jgi:acetoin utilization protein AcuB
MDVRAPISTIMTQNLITINPEDSLEMVKEIFEKNNIHHIPVVRFKKIVGIVSKSDFLHFVRGYSNNEEDEFFNASRLRAYRAEQIMTTRLGKVESTDRIAVALEVFKTNLFHAIPVVDNDELVGIITTHDIIKTLAEE